MLFGAFNINFDNINMGYRFGGQKIVKTFGLNSLYKGRHFITITNM